MIYIQKQIGFYEVADMLPLSYKVGSTLEDYENGDYLLLDEAQEAFRADNPEATPLQVWNMEIPAVIEPDPVQGTGALQIARQMKLQEIAEQDEYSNRFFVSITKGGAEISNIPLWIDKDLRNSLYSITLPALKSDGETTTKLWSTDTPPQSIDVPIDWALDKLPILEIYAKRTYDIRSSNEAAVYAAATVEEIRAIDVKENYPHFLTFELNLDL